MICWERMSTRFGAWKDFKIWWSSAHIQLFQSWVPEYGCKLVLSKGWIKLELVLIRSLWYSKNNSYTLRVSVAYYRILCALSFRKLASLFSCAAIKTSLPIFINYFSVLLFFLYANCSGQWRSVLFKWSLSQEPP